MRDFDIEQREAEAGNVITDEEREARAFRFGGRVLYRKAEVPGAAIYMLGKLGQKGADMTTDARLIAGIIDSIIEDESLQDFQDVMEGRAREQWKPGDGQSEADRPIVPNVKTLQNLMAFLLEGVTGRPLDQASSLPLDSQTPVRDGGTASMDGSEPMGAAV